MSTSDPFNNVKKYGPQAPQIANPWNLIPQENIVSDPDEFKYKVKKQIIQPPEIDTNSLQNLIHIIPDLLANDPDALLQPEFKAINFDYILQAIEFLMNSSAFNDKTKADLLVNSWKLNYKFKPPTPEEFLGEFYLGPTSENIYPHIRKAFIEFMDPMKPYRNGLFYWAIGAGKSMLTGLVNLFTSVHLGLMYKPYKFFAGPQPLNAKIYKPDLKHYYLMGEIKVGDKIASPSEGETEVIELHPQGKIPCYELEFDTGEKVRCGLSHRWNVSYRKDQNNNKIWETVTVEFMLKHPTYNFEFKKIEKQ
jgi:hypothetical protein